MSNHLHPDIHIEIARCLRAGMSLRSVAAKFSVSINTVSLRRKNLIENGVQLDPCACGRSAGHSGWCSVRYAASPRRQAFIQKWKSTAGDEKLTRYKIEKPWYAD